MQFVIITGLSGAGKTNTLHTFEDLGFFCVDNLPPQLIPRFADLCRQQGSVDKAAVVADIRGREFFGSINQYLEEMDCMGIRYSILFLEATRQELTRRYKETRRRHPLAKDGTLNEGIEEEIRLLSGLRAKADHVIDTSGLIPRQLKAMIAGFYSESPDENSMVVNLISFGFKRGVPMEADWVMDMRFLPNPFYIAELKQKSGQTPEVRDYLFQFPETEAFLQNQTELIAKLVPHYVREDKHQLIIGIGCTGGMHRSVAMAEAMYQRLTQAGLIVTLTHRDLALESKA